MNYIALINKLLSLKITKNAIVLDLFAGCGGLSFHFEAAGFKTVGCEMNSGAVSTYKANLKGDCFIEEITLDFEKFTVDNGTFDLMDTYPKESKFLTSSQNTYIANHERASKCINPHDYE